MTAIFHCTNKIIGFFMMNDFAILRTEKLKTFGNIGGSLAHNFRDIETPNADENRTRENLHSLGSATEVMDAIQLRLPEKRRSDAVLCIEHLITASPTWNGWGTEKEYKFFENSKKWLEKQYGSDNVVAVSVHRDETTPHLIAYVVPLDEVTGKLNAKKWLGGRAKMSQMQSDFADQVRFLGLERGIEGSKAKHTRIKEYYAKVNQNEVEITRSIILPTAEWHEDKETYAERCVKSALKDLKDELAFAEQTQIARRKAQEAQTALIAMQNEVLHYLNAKRHLNENECKELDRMILIVSQKLLNQREISNDHHFDF